MSLFSHEVSLLAFLFCFLSDFFCSCWYSLYLALFLYSQWFPLFFNLSRHLTKSRRTRSFWYKYLILFWSSLWWKWWWGDKTWAGIEMKKSFYSCRSMECHSKCTFIPDKTLLIRFSLSFHMPVDFQSVSCHSFILFSMLFQGEVSSQKKPNEGKSGMYFGSFVMSGLSLSWHLNETERHSNSFDWRVTAYSS